MCTCLCVYRVSHLLIALARFFQVEAELVGALSADARSRHSTATSEAYICNRLCDSLQILKRCSCDEQRVAYYAVLTAIAPETGHMNATAERLGVDYRKAPFQNAARACVQHGKRCKLAAQMHGVLLRAGR